MTTVPRLTPRRAVVPRSSSGCWQRQLARTMARSATAVLACAWVDEMVAAPRPRLQSEPLWGRCLAELFAVGERPSSEIPAPKPTRQTAGPPSPAATPPPSGRARQPRVAESPVRRPLPKPSSPPGPAMGHLLQRLAATEADDRPTGLARKAGRRPVDMPLSRPSNGRSVKQTQPPVVATTAAAWREKLARRVSHSLWSEHMGSSGQQRPSDQDEVDMAVVWQRPLHSPTVSAAFLQRADRSDSGLGHELSAGRARSKPKPPPSPQNWPRLMDNSLDQAVASALSRAGRSIPAKPGQPASSQPLPGQQVANRVKQPASDWRAAGQPVAPPKREDQPWLSMPLTDAPGIDTAPSMDGVDRLQTGSPTAPARDNRAGATPQIAPPLNVPLRSPLRPLAHPAAAEPTAARDAARRSARHEEMETAVVDQAQLARQLKQILDEEARRFGIDV